MKQATIVKIVIAIPIIGFVVTGFDLDSIVSFGVLGLIIFAIMYNFSKDCPNCKEWFVDKIVDKQLTNEYQRAKTVSRKEHHYDSDGKKAGHREYREQVRVTTSEYDVFHKCKQCGHQWVTQVTKDEEGGRLD